MTDKGKAPKAEGGVKKAKNGFQKQLNITPELAEFLGTTKVTRPELTKKMWAYFKENSLMDPADKRFVVCDDKLKEITGVERFQAFGFQKHINKHIIKDDAPAPSRAKKAAPKKKAKKAESEDEEEEEVGDDEGDD